MTDVGHGAGSFDHDAFVYSSDDEFVAGLVPACAAALASGGHVLAVVPEANAQILASGLGADAARTSFLAAEDFYHHPVEAIGEYDRLLRALPFGTRGFVVGEVQFGESQRERRSWTRYESALNRALESHDAHLVCPYDARTLPTSLVDAARRTHPHVLGPTGRTESPLYAEPEVLLPLLTLTWDAPMQPPDVDLVVKGSTDAARRAFRRAALVAGFDPGRVEELTLALNEVVTNAIVHGGGQAHLRTWISPEGVTCAIDDEGPGLDDALLGYRPPPPDAEGGYGLWMARKMFDDFEARRAPGGGLAVVLEARTERC